MRILDFNFVISTLCFICFSESRVVHDSFEYGAQQNGSAKLIVVDQSGKGDFTKIQDAIDSIPFNSSRWSRIQVNAGVYKEQIIITQDKSNISLHGVSPSESVIQWDAGGRVDQSSTFTIFADNFKAENIGFQNTYNLIGRRPMTWAPAIRIQADKASFYSCSFLSLQDTVWDCLGRHFFKSCYIQGGMDFIWGTGQSIYQDCTLNFTGTALKGRGYITAQGRESQKDRNGFTFNGGRVIGTGSVYLGRAYGQHSRVVFNKVDLSNVVVPEGWGAWKYTGQEESITYVENRCTGAGSKMSKRVEWMKKLSSSELASLTEVDTFINKDGWLNKQL